MKQRLTERYIINLMREEWTKKVNFLIEKKSKPKKSNKPGDGLTLQVDVDGDGEPESVIDRGFKVEKINDPMSGLSYDVEFIDDDNGTVTLKRPDAKGTKFNSFTVSQKDFEQQYRRK